MTHSPPLTMLKEAVLGAADLSVPWSLFFDLAEHADFIRNGARVRHELLEATVVAATGKLLGKADPSLDRVLLVEVPGEGFIHGTLLIEDRLVGVIYFSGPDVGLMAVPPLHGDVTQFVRFNPSSAIRIPDNAWTMPPDGGRN